MAKPWKEVIASPQYKALPPEQQAEAQAQYFNEVVAPRAGKAAEEARQQFYAAYPPAVSYNQPQPKANMLDNIAYGAKETGRGLLQAGVNLANIPAALTDIFTSGAPSPRITTQDIEKTLGLEENSLTPQSTEAKIFADALGYLIPVVGQEKAAIGAAEIISKLTASKMGFFDKIGTGTAKLADQTVVGSLAANSKPEDQDKLAPDIAMGMAMGGGLNAIGGAIGAGYRAVKGNIAPEKKAMIDFAEKNNLPLMTTDLHAPKTSVGKHARTWGEFIPFTGTGGARKAQKEAREKLVHTFSDEVGGISDDTLYRSATEGQKKFIDAASKRYNRIINAMGDSPVDIGGTVRAIDAHIAEMTKPGKTYSRDALKILHEYKDDITSGANTLRMARDNRTQLRKKFMAKAGEIPSDEVEKAASVVYKAYTDDILKAVNDKLGAQEAGNLLRTDRSWAKFNDMMSNTRVIKALKDARVHPEEVTKLIFSQRPADRAQLYRLLDEKGRQNARAALVKNAVDKATDKDGTLSVEKFLTAINKTEKQAVTFFKGEHKGRLEGIKTYLNATKQSSTAGAHPINGQIVKLPTAISAVGGALVNPTMAKIVLISAAFGGGARTYESRAVMHGLLRLASTPKGSTEFEKNVRLINRSLTALTQGIKSEELN